MAVWKWLPAINWLLIIACAAAVLYCLIVINGATSATGRSLETTLKRLCVLALLGLIGLNLLPYSWTKVVTCLLGIILLLLFGYTLTR